MKPQHKSFLTRLAVVVALIGATTSCGQPLTQSDVGASGGLEGGAGGASTTSSQTQQSSVADLPSGVPVMLPELERGRLAAYETPETVLSEHGDYLIHDSIRDDFTSASYDASQLVRVVDASSGIAANTGAVSGGPDSPDPFLRLQDYAQSRAASEAEAAGATIADLEGVVEYSENFGVDRETEELLRQVAVIDLGTGLLVSAPTDGGRETPSELAPAIRTEVQAEVFSPPSDFLRTVDLGFKLVDSVATAAALGGLEVKEPTLPEGFELIQVAFAETPVSRLSSQRSVVSLTYRFRGWRVDVTYRDLGSLNAEDPYASSGYLNEDRKVLGTGEVVTGGAINHAWALDGSVLVTVAGALGPKALDVAIASVLG